MKRRWSLIILIYATLLLISGMVMTVSAEESTDQLISVLELEINAPLCGQETDSSLPQQYEPEIYDNEGVHLAEPSAWIIDYNDNDPALSTLYEGKIVGDQVYTALITLEPETGYRFDENIRLFFYNTDLEDYVESVPLKQDASRIIVKVDVRAEHDWDWGNMAYLAPTCMNSGERHSVCSADPSHTLTEVIPVNPEAHVWSEWTITRESTKAHPGEQEHTCTLCGKVETEEIPKISLPYTKVYEPDTSWPMAATISWRTDSSALNVAEASKRPATAFIWLDSDLKVYDRNGSLLANHLDSYVDYTVAGMIPAFYIKDAETASALKSWLSVSGLLDCYVVSTPENKALVKDVADILHVRGMLDYTSIKNPGRLELLNMIASVNGAHGKVVLLSTEAATRENVRLMQSLAATVWAQAPADTKTLVTLYTNGVNGVVMDDYMAAIHAEELFKDDAPSLLRIPLIIGHRGDPSSYVENTLDSALGAFQEGVDSVENDIQLSADGQLFILHDDSPYRFMGILEVEKAEDLTLSDLKSLSFSWDSPDYGIIASNEVPAYASRYGTLYGQEDQKQYTVPTLKEYIEAFKGSGLVHDTEIKSYNPAIIPVYKALVDQYDAWDQFFTITFNRVILDAIYRDYPEISIGALGFGDWTEVKYGSYDEITENEGTEAALKALYDTIDQWNATYNPQYFDYGEKMVSAGRHRGLTVWPWTYSLGDADSIAHDYLQAVTGMTIDYPWVVSDNIIEISYEDITVLSIDDIPKPQGKTQAGEQRVLDSAELVKLENLDTAGSRQLMIWRYEADMNINGESYGSYYLYSNPFVVSKSSGYSGGTTSVRHAVIISDSIVGGTAIVDTKQAEKGEQVTITVTPDEGYQTVSVAVKDAKGNEVDMTDNGDGTYSFTMPSSETTVTPTFTETQKSDDPVEPDSTACPRDNTCPITPFKDTDKNEWYHDGVHWALEKAIMNGTGKDTFEPLTSTSRAMIVTMLWRMEGSPRVDDNMTFKDVPNGQWYTDAIRWAATNDVVTGYDEDTFGANDSVTREQIVTILYRYVQFKGVDVSNGETAYLNGYTDARDISEWAVKAFRWAVDTGIIQGMSETDLVPQGKAARAQVATMLMRYCNQVK